MLHNSTFLVTKWRENIVTNYQGFICCSSVIQKLIWKTKMSAATERTYKLVMFYLIFEFFMFMASVLDPVLANPQEEPWLTDSHEEVMIVLDESNLPANIKIKNALSTLETNSSFLDSNSSNNFVKRATIVVEKETKNVTLPTTTIDSKCEPKILDEEPIEPVT